MNFQKDSTLNQSSRQHVLTDTHQSFWQLAAIQLIQVASLPVLVCSMILVREHSLINSILVLLISNIISWVIRYYLIVMCSNGRKSVMDIVEDYFGRVWILGRGGVYLIAVLLLLTAMALFLEGTTLQSNALVSLFPLNEGPDIDPFMQIGVLIGILSTIFCARGMVVLRKLSTAALPIILIALGILVMTSFSSIEFIPHRSFSLSALPKVLAINLAVTADLPTFFRHSRSWNSSMKALTAIQILSFLIGIAGLYLVSMINPSSGIPNVTGIISTDSFSKLAFILLVVFSGIGANISNIYASSVGWETFAPLSLVGKKEYLIIGFLITLFYLSVAGLIPTGVFVSITSDSVVNLTIVFVLGFFISKLLTRPLDRSDRSILFFSWLISTVLNIGQNIGVVPFETSSLVISCLLIPLLVVFAYGLKFCIALVKPD